MTANSCPQQSGLLLQNIERGAMRGQQICYTYHMNAAIHLDLFVLGWLVLIPDPILKELPNFMKAAQFLYQTKHPAQTRTRHVLQTGVPRLHNTLQQNKLMLVIKARSELHINKINHEQCLAIMKMAWCYQYSS